MEARDVMKAMEERARELGWAVESNWRDTTFGTDEFDVYLWQDESRVSAEERSDDTKGSTPSTDIEVG